MRGPIRATIVVCNLVKYNPLAPNFYIFLFHKSKIMKKLFLLILCVPFIGFGQDNIILKTGDEISSNVIEIDKETV